MMEKGQKKFWITTKTMKTMEERRTYKNKNAANNRSVYRKLVKDRRRRDKRKV